ncbi:MAG: BatD family protein [Dokdonella sp.]|uniref:BatD family protein n=1 Tax=Dokdonella sp. TaxID=2291710 RepID=UPI0032645A7A
MARPAWVAMWIALFVSFCAHADTPTVRAWLDRATMQMGETVTLNVESSESNGTPPDFSALKQDFNLLGTQSSQQVSITNGSSQSKSLWAIGLEPKHTGHIAIAPIAVGDAKTSAIELNVVAPATTASGKAGDDIFLEATVDPLTPYVQQEVNYTVKLYFAFDLTEGNLSEPQADGISVQRLGQEKKYVATLGARRYNVVERHYALTPERSGALELPPLVFRGTALDVNDPSGFFSRGRSVSAHSETVHLQVKPKPAEWIDAAWLPATSLLLKDETELPTQVRVGDPITRTIREQAQGMGFEQVPEITLGAVEGAEVYPDKADTRTRDDGEWRYGERVRKFAFVPNRPGTLTIPGLKVRWWDTVHDRAQIAELPAHTVQVLPAAGAAVAPSPTTGEVAQTPESARAGGTAILPGAGVVSEDAIVGRTTLWRTIAIGVFALWLLTLGAWWRSRRVPSPVAGNAPVAPDSSSQRAAFLRACAMGEFAGAERALVAWARSERSDVRNLGELGARLDDPAQRDALADLQRTRYAGASSQGLGARLKQAFQRGLAWRSTGGERRIASALPALYPERD